MEGLQLTALYAAADAEPSDRLHELRWVEAPAERVLVYINDVVKAGALTAAEICKGIEDQCAAMNPPVK